MLPCITRLLTMILYQPTKRYGRFSTKTRQHNGQWYNNPGKGITDDRFQRQVRRLLISPSITLVSDEPRISLGTPYTCTSNCAAHYFRYNHESACSSPGCCTPSSTCKYQLNDLPAPFGIEHSSEEAFECHSLLREVSGEGWGPQSQED